MSDINRTAWFDADKMDGYLDGHVCILMCMIRIRPIVRPEKGEKAVEWVQVLQCCSEPRIATH